MALSNSLSASGVRRLAYVTGGSGLIAFYLAQHWRLSPSNTDDGLILDYIHQMSMGARPHRDMMDAYGLLNWILPVWFYDLAGQQVWGVRVCVLLIKLSSVLLAYRVVARLTSRFYGVLAALLLTVLLGQPWQSLQTAYAFITVVPLILGAWYVLIQNPFSRWWLNAGAAALLSAAAIWTKLNAGLFLFAGGLFFYLCLADSGRLSARGGSLLARFKLGAAVTYLLVFGSFSALYFSWVGCLYLLLPLCLGFGWAAYTQLRGRSESRPSGQLRAALLYTFCTAACSAGVLFGYYGVVGGAHYVLELAQLLTSIEYEAPFPEIGKSQRYVGFNENYWPQLPWLLSAVFAAWLFMHRKWGPVTFGETWPARRTAAGAAFVLVTLHSFVLYPRSDETHIFQALILVVPVLFILLFQVERMLKHALPRVTHVRETLALATALYASTLGVRPTLEPLKISPGDYASPHLAHLQYRPLFNSRVKNLSPHLTDRDWDKLVDDAARYIDGRADKNEPILVLNSERLLHIASNTTAAGGRYAFCFYLVSVRLLDRAGFDKLVPPEVVDGIVENPPRVLVTSGNDEPLLAHFPEFRQLRDFKYQKTRSFRHLKIYELRSEHHRASFRDHSRAPTPRAPVSS